MNKYRSVLLTDAERSWLLGLLRNRRAEALEKGGDSPETTATVAAAVFAYDEMIEAMDGKRRQRRL